MADAPEVVVLHGPSPYEEKILSPLDPSVATGSFGTGGTRVPASNDAQPSHSTPISPTELPSSPFSAVGVATLDDKEFIHETDQAPRALEPDEPPTRRFDIQSRPSQLGAVSAWHFGFWRCLDDPGLCLESIVCPCVLAGRTHTRLHNVENDSLPSTNSYCLCCGALIFAIFPVWLCMTTAQRREIRYRYNIKGTNLEDYWRSAFCWCCQLVQEEREVTWRMNRRNASGPEETAGMKSRDDTMTYARQ